uniref:Uncharacterized protein n=1 Tax=Medicago truncatula TaxID=3880 RepID=Q2HTY6_MEDTR|nr:hypothetical protein MtrDRAFT_AC149577g21v1 [Medicago truncatula]
MDICSLKTNNEAIEVKWLMSSIKGQIVKESMSLLFGWNNSWQTFSYLPTEL